MGATERAPLGGAEQDEMGRQHIFAVNNSPDLLDIFRMLFQRHDYNITATSFAPQIFEQIVTL